MTNDILIDGKLICTKCKKEKKLIGSKLVNKHMEKTYKCKCGITVKIITS